MIRVTSQYNVFAYGGLLGIDVGATTGYAYANPSKELCELGLIKLTSQAKGFKKLSTARADLATVLDLTRPSVVVIEGALASGKGFGGAASKIELHGVYKLALEEYGKARLEVIYPSSLKKFMTGHGRSSKDLVREAVNDHYPEAEFVTHDQSDAAALVIWGLAEKFQSPGQCSLNFN